MPTPKLLPPPNTLTPPPRVHRGPSPKIHETRDILHIYWDQASVLVQLGLLDPDGLPIAGAETARKVLDVSLPSNTLMTPSQATG
jgi:hypothetical protein